MRCQFLSVVCGLVLIAAGCGGSTAPVDPQAQVSGSVTNDGKPLGLGSRVVFYNAEKGLTLTGTLDSLGKYSLTAADPKVGVPVGRYVVSVMPPVAAVTEVNPSSPDYQKMMQGGGGEATMASSKPAAAADIPEKFNDPKTSGLEFEVKQGPNTFDFDLAKL